MRSKALALPGFAALLFLTATQSFAAWDLVWSDEFDSYTGTPDKTKWRIQVGPSMVNNEAQYYSDRTKNIEVKDGNMYIRTYKEAFGGRQYTSGRLDTETKVWWTYGRFEIKAKIPGGKGSWPAFWTLGHECDKNGGWPNCGEIDIMEYAGKNPNKINTTMHMRDVNYRLGNNPHGSITLPDVHNTFNIYALEWFKDRLDIYVNSTKILTYKNDGKGFGTWPYTNPQYIILNTALGGGYGGPIDDAIFPIQWTIDYVRVYKETTGPTGIQAFDAGNQMGEPRFAVMGGTGYDVLGRSLSPLRTGHRGGTTMSISVSGPETSRAR
jgi:beta-glucanase (GH16 family)